MATQPIAQSQPLISQPPTVTNMEFDDDDAIADQVKATHHPDAYGYGATNLNANFVLSYAENILNFNHLVSGEVEKDMLMPQKHIHKELSYQMLQLSFEVVFKCLNNIDCHSATIHLLSMLSTYPWDTKVVMMLGAFSLICGHYFTTVSQRHCRRKKLANMLASFKENLIANAPSCHIEKLVGDNDSIIKFIIDLVKCVSELNQPPSFSPPQPLLLATYWITRSILTCSQRILCVE
nr:protein SIEVE ELEMENT OCCLUSION B-like [Ipomoea trifida]